MVFSRRQFLRTTAAGIGALATSRVAVGQETSRFGVVVIGAGMAGLFCAMRLRAAGFDVGLFEASDRLGGRVMSVLLPGFTTHAAEIGAMRLRSTDAIEMQLIDTLLGAKAKVPFDYPTHAWFLRNRLLHRLDDPAQLPYALDRQERAVIAGGGDLLFDTIRRMAAMNDRGSAIDRGVWQEVLRIRSKDGRDFITDSNGYDLLALNWNADAAVPWFEQLFTASRYYHVPGGLQRLPDAIAAAYRGDDGVMFTGHALRAIRRGNGADMVLSFGTGAGTHEVTTPRVVLAIPPASLERLDPGSFILQDARFRAALNGVQRISLGKIHLSFETPWWEAAGYGTGLTITDLPVRQTYFWGRDETTGMGLTLASYHDGPANGFWKALDVGDAYGPPDWIGNARGVDGLPLPASLVRTLPVSRLMAQEAWSQVRTIHALPDDAPPPVHGTYRNWGDDPLYGAAMHLWAIGTDAGETMRYMREPFPGLHVCGEAWSTDQGWISGATSTAEAVLQNKFGLPAYLSG